MASTVAQQFGLLNLVCKEEQGYLRARIITALMPG